MYGHDSYKQFAIVRDEEPCHIVLHVFGDVDLSTVGELKAAIDEIDEDGNSVLINLSKCRYFDSSGLAALIRARTILGTRLTLLVDPKSQISRVMSIVGFDTLFNVVTELRTARRDDVVYDPSFISPSNAQPSTTFGFARQR